MIHGSDNAPPSSRGSGTGQPAGLSITGLEAVYDQLAGAIDQAGPQRSDIFLVKLVLLQAQACGDAAAFGRHVQAALRDL